MNIVFGVIIGFLILMLLVVAHEFGHFIAARRNGVTVEEFGIGFPPRAVAWLKNPEYDKWKKTGRKGKKPKKWLKFPRSEWDKNQNSLIFSINYLPIGGFCQMKGESDSDKRPHSFGQASLWQKTKILFAGVTMNWLVAWIILSILSITGMPEFMNNQFHMPGDTSVSASTVKIKEIIAGSPADNSELKVGDKIVKVGDNDIITSEEIFKYNDAHKGETVTYSVISEEENSPHEVTVSLNSKDEDYILGVYLSQADLPTYHSTWSAPIVGAVNTVQLTGETYRGLWEMLRSLCSGIVKQFNADESVRSEGKAELQFAGDSVSGPVGIIGIIFPQSIEAGPTTLAFLAAIISISLACMNVLPIPALDGGRFIMIAFYRLRGKVLTKEKEEKLVSRTFVFLLILIAVVTVLDILRFF
ncbi:site-2 protease family protein [Candidatus Saccharibacteria bacterium]|nr:site-2 protease family protein [Candidatus Saccharibacteria bacterium]